MFQMTKTAFQPRPVKAEGRVVSTL